MSYYACALTTKNVNKLSLARRGLAAAAAGTKILFAGGFTTSSNTSTTTRVDIYDTSNDSWSIAELSQARGYLAAAAVGTKIVFAGGLKADGFSSEVLDIYDTSTNSWSSRVFPSFEDRYFLASAGINSIVGFYGGFGDLSFRDTMDIINFSNSTDGIQFYGTARERLAGAAANNKMYFGGGQYVSGVTFIQSSEINIYNTTTNTFLSNIALSTGRRNLAAAAAGTKVLFGGGNTNTSGTGFTPSAVVDIIDSINDTVTSTNLPGGAREFLAAAGLSNKVYFGGGNTSSGAAGVSNKVDIYNVDTSSWSSATLSVARDELAAAAAGTKVVFAGGGINGSVSDAVDIFEV